MKSLLLITHEYPIKRGDASFIESEIPYLAKLFNKVYVITLAKNIPYQNDELSNTPKNVIVIFPKHNLKHNNHRKFDKVASYFSLLFTPVFILEVLSIITVWGISIKHLRQAVKFYKRAVSCQASIKQILEHDKNIGLIYTYWYTSETLSALLLKKNYNNIPCVTRTHGYDLYKFRNKLGYQPYKTWMDKKINKVFFISQHGYNYYLNEFAKSETKKYCLSRLGIINNYFAELDKQEKNNNTLVLCSCSYIVPVKRLHHIIKALGQINEYKIHWIHIGDGPEKNSIESLADEILGNKNNITYEFKGFMNNDHVMQFYNANYFDCFISASESEGLPVSMMEAISFQIPVIATDVGGVSELVSKETGILLSSEGNISEISKAIVDFYNLSSDNKNSMRKAARLFWESNFNAEVNHAKFANELIKLANNNNQSK